MKKNMISSYIAGITDIEQGEHYLTILKYFLPEFISALLLYSLPQLIDSYFISLLTCTTTYATVGVTNNIMHFFLKIADAFSVGTVVLVGQYNGRGLFKEVGKVGRDAFWVTCIIGSLFAGALYIGAFWIYYWSGVTPEIISLGVSFLRYRALGIFFTFIYMALVGFLRGIKNTKVPMYIFMFGSIVFVLLDYILIFGKFGFPALGLIGSALATMTQHAIILFLIIMYIFFDNRNKKYQISLSFSLHDLPYIKQLFLLSLPVVVDKAMLAAAYWWLMKMICPMGTKVIASFSLIKDMERFAFLPAIAFAQVITFLASNDCGRQLWEDIKTNIKKIGFLASLMVGSILIFFSLAQEFIINIFDKHAEFGPLVARAFPVLSILVFFDLAQLILSGALRGSGNVHLVMSTRLFICIVYFVPVSYMLSMLPIADEFTKFVLIYGSFYVGNGLMSIAYINRLRSEEWKISTVQGIV